MELNKAEGQNDQVEKALVANNAFWFSAGLGYFLYSGFFFKHVLLRKYSRFNLLIKLTLTAIYFETYDFVAFLSGKCLLVTFKEWPLWDTEIEILYFKMNNLGRIQFTSALLPGLKKSDAQSEYFIKPSTKKNHNIIYQGSQLFRESRKSDSSLGKVNNISQEKKQQIGLFSSENIVKPKLVQNRSEWNSNIYLLQKRKKHRKYKPIQTFLKIAFPIHHIRDYIQQHATGYQNKNNIDLFKHYYRMYMSHQWLMKQIKKKKAIQKQKLLQKMRNDAFSTSPNPPKSSKEGEKTVKKVPLTIKSFIISKTAIDLKLYCNILSSYEQEYQPLQIIEARNYAQQKQDFANSLSNQIFHSKVSYRNLEMQNQYTKQQQYGLIMLEEIFIKRIMTQLQEKGLTSLSYIDYITFKEIVTKRTLQQSDLERSISLNKIIKIKQNLSNQSFNQMKINQLMQIVSWLYDQQKYKIIQAQQEYKRASQLYQKTQSSDEGPATPPPEAPVDINALMEQLKNFREISQPDDKQIDNLRRKSQDNMLAQANQLLNYLERNSSKQDEAQNLQLIIDSIVQTYQEPQNVIQELDESSEYIKLESKPSSNQTMVKDISKRSINRHQSKVICVLKDNEDSELSRSSVIHSSSERQIQNQDSRSRAQSIEAQNIFNKLI